MRHEAYGWRLGSGEPYETWGDVPDVAVGGRTRERDDRSHDGNLGRSALTSQLINGEAREITVPFAVLAMSLHIPDNALITDINVTMPRRHIPMAGLPDPSRYVSRARDCDLLITVAPKPSGWALMLIGFGFGLVDAVQRRHCAAEQAVAGL